MSAESRVEAIRVLSHAAGADGMVAGQVIDTLCGVSTQQELTGMYRLKTGVMISAAAELGCVASGMPATMRQQAIAFADENVKRFTDGTQIVKVIYVAGKLLNVVVKPQ